MGSFDGVDVSVSVLVSAKGSSLGDLAAFFDALDSLFPAAALELVDGPVLAAPVPRCGLLTPDDPSLSSLRCWVREAVASGVAADVVVPNAAATAVSVSAVSVEPSCCAEHVALDPVGLWVTVDERCRAHLAAG